MGRPLNKKYFGNRNVGSTGTGDNGIGGEGVAGVTTADQGSININDTYKHFPTLTGTAPTIAGGVTATYAVTWEIDTVTFDGGGSTYTTGLTTAITGLTSQASVAPVINITHVTGGAPDAYNFTGGSRGEFTSIDGTGITTWAIVQGAHTGAQATITFRVKSIAVTEKGSGYVTVPSLSWSALGGTTPSNQTPSLTTDSGYVGSSTNQENAIIAYAYIASSLREVDIQKQVSTDRYKVKATGQTVTIGKLATTKADGSYATNWSASREGVEVNIVALDDSGGTYLVKKLTAHKAVLVPCDVDWGPAAFQGSAGTTWAPATAGVYKSVKWSFGAATSTSVQIANA